jgi:hypothetical protein
VRARILRVCNRRPGGSKRDPHPMYSVRLHYRPLRFGWCVRPDNHADLRRALRLTHALWGGAYNPIVAVDGSEAAAHLVRVFRLDALFPVTADASLEAFIAGFPFLPWPNHEEGMFTTGPDWPSIPHFVDLLNIAEFAKRSGEPLRAVLYEWEPEDPLADVLLATVGDLPGVGDATTDYRRSVEQNLGLQRLKLSPTADLPDLTDHTSLSDATTFMLEPDTRPGDHAGFFVGSADNVADVTWFWNLRAAGNSLVFFDPSQADRLEQPLRRHLSWLRSRRARSGALQSRVTLWSGRRDPKRPPGDLGTEVSSAQVSPDLWNGLNLHPAVYRTEGKSLLLLSEHSEGLPSLVVPLDNPPYATDYPFSLQTAVASIAVSETKGGRSTFRVPYLPALNPLLGRAYANSSHAGRAERDGVGVVVNVSDKHVWARAVTTTDVISATFKSYGVTAEPSQPGLVATRLIDQMGGYQGCRAFKVKGVRDLMRRYRPDQSFTRQEGEQIIGDLDPKTRRPRFEAYQGLYLEPRKTPHLTPKHVFSYLLRKGVFRVGQELLCPNCRLEFWRSLDDLRTVARCELCGKKFSILDQLRDRDWRYRRSGLFGREDQQHGAIPVALALQQLHSTLGHPFDGVFLAGTSTNLKATKEDISDCETDLILLTQDQNGSEFDAQVLIGECKSEGQRVTEDDARKLGAIANVIGARDDLRPYVLFAKPAPFSDEELRACTLAQDAFDPRVIILSDRELEPYHVYETTKKQVELGRLSHGRSLKVLAEATITIHPVLRPKAWPEDSTPLVTDNPLRPK